MIDIEELTVEPTNRTDPSSHYAVPNASLISKGNACINQESEKLAPFLPGQSRIFVKTWGCGHNNSDGEYMAGMLASEGYGVVLEHEKANDADVWVLNSCTVKGPSQQTFENDIKKGLEAGKKIVVAGCVPQGNNSIFSLI